MTYDGTGYTYHGKCDMVMARSTNLHNTGLTLDVNARTSIQGDWSYISNVATRIGEDVLEITSSGTHYFNGVEGTEFPLEIGGRYVATRVERTLESGDIRTEYTIDLMIHSDDHTSGDLIRISSFKEMLSVTVDAMLHDTYGMLGITGKDGMIGRDLQTVINDSNIMGAQWQVNNTEPMLFHEIRAPQYPEACQLPKVDSRRRLRAESGESMRRAQEACAGVEENMRDFCIHDVRQTGDSSYALPYLQ
jgi:von Willebrand factor type D domain